MILQRLSFVLQKAGAAVHIEPNWFEGKRPDAQVNFAHENVMIDASVTHPSSPSLCQGAAGKPLSAAAGATKDPNMVAWQNWKSVALFLCVGVVWLIREPRHQVYP